MLPYLNAPNQEINMITQFGGYNHRTSIAENQFFDMKNMSSKDFPLASTRNKRGIISNEFLEGAVLDALSARQLGKDTHDERTSCNVSSHTN
jgi:hypothetical protein